MDHTLAWFCVIMICSNLLDCYYPIILSSQLHVHIVFDGNRVFQAQMKLWGVSEDKGAQEGGHMGVKRKARLQ